MDSPHPFDAVTGSYPVSGHVVIQHGAQPTNVDSIVNAEQALAQFEETLWNNFGSGNVNTVHWYVTALANALDASARMRQIFRDLFNVIHNRDTTSAIDVSIGAGMMGYPDR